MVKFNFDKLPDGKSTASTSSWDALKVLSAFNGVSEVYDKVYKFGRAEVGTAEKLISDIDTTYNVEDANINIDVVSDNVADAIAGAGARKIRIFGLYEDSGKWKERSVDVEMNGTTTVQASLPFIHIHRVRVIESTARGVISGANTGTITVHERGNAGNVKARVLPNIGSTLMLIYTPPTHTEDNIPVIAGILNADANIGQGKDCTVFLKTRQNFDENYNKVIDKPFVVRAIRDLYQNSFKREYDVIRVLEPGTSVCMNAKTSTGTVSVSGSFEIVLFKVE